MASGQVLAQSRQLYAKAQRQLDVWDATSAAANARFATLANITGRLPALQRPELYDLLGGAEAVQAPLLTAQLAQFERVMAALRTDLLALEAAVTALQRLSCECRRLMTPRNAQAPLASAAEGPVPSPAAIADGLQTVWRMHWDDLALRQAAIERLNYSTPSCDAEALASLFAASLDIDAGAVQDIMLVVRATEPRPTVC